MTDVQGVWKDDTTFEVTQRGTEVTFDRRPDGTMYVGVDGYGRETFVMTAEQVAAFKVWMMEN